MASATPGFTDPFIAATLTQYGAAMLVVQSWEVSLAALVGAASLKPPQGKPAQLERAIRKAVKKAWKLLQNSTASELRNQLTVLIDDETITDRLVAEISTLNEWRNFLAHRYLRSRLFDGSTLASTPAHVVELFKIGQAFGANSERIGAATQAKLAQLPVRDAPDAAKEVFRQAAVDILRAQPKPFGTRPPK